MKKPNPIEWPSEAIPARYLHCERYNQCLTLAAREDWIGFECSACPIWIEKEKEIKEKWKRNGM